MSLVGMAIDVWTVGQGVRLPFAGSGCMRVSSFFRGIIPHALLFSFVGKHHWAVFFSLACYVPSSLL